MSKCALVIGHSPTSPGAVNIAEQISEFHFNRLLAEHISQRVKQVEVDVVYRQSYRDLPYKVNQLKPDFIISLHCNAFNQKASGTETLFYHKSSQGKAMAEQLNARLVQALGLKNRGCKGKRSEDRGGYLLRFTHAPCVIAEPFFIDSDSDLAVAQERYQHLVQAYVDSIETMAQGLG